MSDVFTKAKRSHVMSRIRGKGNKATEVAMMKLLRRHHICGWRRHPAMFGKPDFVFRKSRVAIFVDGCFWHGCPSHCNMPRNNSTFWKCKLETNKRRDRTVTRLLRSTGWRVLRIWEHDLTPARQARLLRRIKETLAA